MGRFIQTFRAVSVAFMLLSAGILSAEVFTYKYTEGGSYRILSTVQEDVYVNRRFNHRAEIVNRISVTISDIENGWAAHKARFMTSETSTGASSNVFSWGEEYLSEFKRDATGLYDIQDTYYMPVVRNVPVFPAYDLKPGDTWIGTGEEVHDLRRGFDIEKPFHVPFTVQYMYIGSEEAAGKTLHKITAEYSLYYRSPQPAIRTADYPETTMGFSSQTIWWNTETGSIEFYTENFRIIMELASGNVYEFRGTARAETAELEKTGKTDVQKIQQTLKELGIQDTVVTSGEKGITIALENIRFHADSSELEESEKSKLQKLAPILAAYPDNDLLISGHTALAGTAGARQRLSQERANAVAAFLMSLGIKDQYHIFTQGFGSDIPIADNKTSEGMARNRRVEITILQQ